MARAACSHLGVLLLVILALSWSGRAAYAMPPHPELVMQSRKMAAAVNQYAQLRAGFAERGICQPGGGLAAGTQLSGDFNMLAVCVQFTDHAATVSAFEFDTLMFHQGAGSVWDYYREVSYNTFSIVAVDLPSDIGWITNSNTYEYYVNNNYAFGSYPRNSQKLVEDLVDLIDPFVDFSVYDNDGNGYVDGLIVVHSGTGAELSGNSADIWSHKWGISPRLKDGVYISSFSIQPEFWINPGDITIGVYAHEIGHVFGLPDLYDLDNSSRGIGRWSLMATGSWNGSLGNSPAHPDAWCRKQLGFCTPTVVGSNLTGVNIPSVQSSPTIYRLWEDGGGGSQYFLVENRQRAGYDAALPSSGLLIWHIDDSKTNNTKEWYPGYTSSGNYWVALEQADGLWELEKNLNYGNSGDPFPGSTNKTTFSAATTPSSDAYSGAATYVTITNISSSGPTMTCDFSVSLETNVFEEAGGDGLLPSVPVWNYPNPFNPTTIVNYQVSHAGAVRLTVHDVLGRRVATLVSGEVEPGNHQVEWNGRDEDGSPVASGVYFARLESAHLSSVRKMVLVR